MLGTSIEKDLELVQCTRSNTVEFEQWTYSICTFDSVDNGSFRVISLCPGDYIHCPKGNRLSAK